MNTQRDAARFDPHAEQNEGHAPQWIDATEASRRLGISARAVQKRCAVGKMKARRITTPQGVRWELDAREVECEPANQTNEQDANQRTERREPGSFDAQNGTNRDANRRTEGREPTNTQNDELRELLSRERENAVFLRGVIEQLQRDAIELRAIARDALKIAPRQLAQGSATTPENGTQSGAANNVPDTMINAPKSKRNGHNADEMDADELLALCRRIST